MRDRATLFDSNTAFESCWIRRAIAKPWLGPVASVRRIEQGQRTLQELPLLARLPIDA